VAEVEMDVERGLFRISGDSASETTVLETIRKLGYEPSIAASSEFHATGAFHPVGEMPELVRAALGRARAESKRFVIVDCAGDS
jgi:hypothetical protein